MTISMVFRKNLSQSRLLNNDYSHPSPHVCLIFPLKISPMPPGEAESGVEARSACKHHSTMAGRTFVVVYLCCCLLVLLSTCVVVYLYCCLLVLLSTCVVVYLYCYLLVLLFVICLLWVLISLWVFVRQKRQEKKSSRSRTFSGWCGAG